MTSVLAQCKGYLINTPRPNRPKAKPFDLQPHGSTCPQPLGRFVSNAYRAAGGNELGRAACQGGTGRHGNVLHNAPERPETNDHHHGTFGTHPRASSADGSWVSWLFVNVPPRLHTTSGRGGGITSMHARRQCASPQHHSLHSRCLPLSSLLPLRRRPPAPWPSRLAPPSRYADTISTLADTDNRSSPPRRSCSTFLPGVRASTPARRARRRAAT